MQYLRSLKSHVEKTVMIDELIQDNRHNPVYEKTSKKVKTCFSSLKKILRTRVLLTQNCLLKKDQLISLQGFLYATVPPNENLFWKHTAILEPIP